MGENSKRNNYAMKHKMHLSLLLLDLVDKQKIKGVGHLFWMHTNQLTSKNLNKYSTFHSPKPNLLQ